jgi:hypothetical protein
MARPKRSETKHPAHHHVPYHRNRTVLIVSVVGAFLALFVFSQILGTDYTGYVNANINTVRINEIAYGGTRMTISSGGGELISMSAARLSGRIYGPGTVRVYLVDGEDMLLVFSNSGTEDAATPKDVSGEEIARSKILDESTFPLPGQSEQGFRLDVAEDSSRVFDVGVYGKSYKLVGSACTETCRMKEKLKSSYTFVFEMDQGTAFEVTDIGFA